MRWFTTLLIIVAVLIAAFFIGWARVPDMLASNLSKKFGVPVSIRSMGLTPSKITVNHLNIGNAKGYSLPKAFSAEEIEIKAPLANYLKNEILVPEIDIENVYLGLEFDSSSGTSGNWTQILDNFKQKANLDETGGKKVYIKRLIVTNINCDLLFRGQGGSVTKLPTIDRIELNDISTEGGFPTDQLMESILGQMLKEVFLRQNLGNMIKGFLETPQKAIDKVLKPFEGIFNIAPEHRKKTNNIA